MIITGSLQNRMKCHKLNSAKIKFLVIGGDGLIGSSLVQFLRTANESVISTTRRKFFDCLDCIYLDLKDDVSKLKFDYTFDVVVFCSGITKVDHCEKDKLTSRLVNVESICKLASIFADKGTRIIFLSSNAVFDGSKEFPSNYEGVSPVTEYGRQKVEVERYLIKEYASLVTVLRLTKILGARNPLFDNWSLALKRGDSIQPFSDMYIAPIPVSFVISVIRLVVDRNVKGVLHLSGDKDFSYADIAFMASNWLGAKKEQVKPIHAGESNLDKIVIRTSKTALDISRLECELGIVPPSSRWTIKQAFCNVKCLNGSSSTIM